MKTLLLTAFGRFGPYTANSTEVLAHRLHGGIIDEYRVETVVFDCTIPDSDRGRELLDTAVQKHCSAIISLGMWSDKKGLCLESRAYNLIDSKYGSPEINGRKVIETHEPNRALDLDSEPWNLTRFYNSCNAQHARTTPYSQDAGRFCCNHLMYQVRNWQLQESRFATIPFMFIHIPCSVEAIPNVYEHVVMNRKIIMNLDEVVRGLNQLLKGAKLP